jgi:hypothetical protein
MIQVSESLNGMLEKTNKQIEEHFNSISKEYDKRLLEAVSIFNSKSSEVFEKFDVNSVKLNELINKTGQNADKLESVLYSSLGQINDGIKNNLDSLTTSFKENLSQLRLLNEQFPVFLNTMEVNNSQIKTTIGSFDSIIVKFENNIQSNVGKYFETIQKVTVELDNHFAKMQKEYGRIISNIDSFNRAQTFSSELIDEFKKSVELTLEPINQFKNAADEVRRTFDDFETEFLKEQKVLFTKISEQKDIPVNLVMGEDGSISLRNKRKMFDSRSERKNLPNKKDVRPLTPPPGYFDKKNVKPKEIPDSNKDEKHIDKEVKLDVPKSHFKKFLFKLMGLDETEELREDSLSDGLKEKSAEENVNDKKGDVKDEKETPVQ